MQGFVTDPSDVDADADRVQARLLLPMDAKVVIVTFRTDIFPLPLRLPSKALDNSGAKTVQSPFLQKKR